MNGYLPLPKLDLPKHTPLETNRFECARFDGFDAPGKSLDADDNNLGEVDNNLLKHADNLRHPPPFRGNESHPARRAGQLLLGDCNRPAYTQCFENAQSLPRSNALHEPLLANCTKVERFQSKLIKNRLNMLSQKLLFS